MKSTELFSFQTLRSITTAGSRNKRNDHRLALRRFWIGLLCGGFIAAHVSIHSSMALDSVPPPDDPGPDPSALPAATDTALPSDPQQQPPPPPETAAAPEENLPPIEARIYQVKVLKITPTRKAFLLEKIPSNSPDDAKPASEGDITITQSGKVQSKGKLLMLRQNGKNVMALRVLREVPQKNEIYAKKIRAYPEERELIENDEYRAIEKIQDLAPLPPKVQEQDKKDLKELGAPLPFEPDLDAPSSPAPESSPEITRKAVEGPEDEIPIGTSVEEFDQFDPHRHWFTGQYGLLRNTPDTAMSRYYSSMGIRYGFTPFSRIIFRNPAKYDSITLEGGMFFYKILNLDESGDSYTLLPLVGTLRYTIFFNEDLGFFLYGGVTRSFVMTATLAHDDRLQNLALPQPSGGAGLLFRIGPGWYVRTEAGIDIVGLGLMLRF